MGNVRENDDEVARATSVSSTQSTNFKFAPAAMAALEEICALRGGISIQHALSLSIFDELYFVRTVTQGEQIYTGSEHGRKLKLAPVDIFAKRNFG